MQEIKPLNHPVVATLSRPEVTIRTRQRLQQLEAVDTLARLIIVALAVRRR